LLPSCYHFCVFSGFRGCSKRFVYEGLRGFKINPWDAIGCGIEKTHPNASQQQIALGIIPPSPPKFQCQRFTSYENLRSAWSETKRPMVQIHSPRHYFLLRFNALRCATVSCELGTLGTTSGVWTESANPNPTATSLHLKEHRIGSPIALAEFDHELSKGDSARIRGRTKQIPRCGSG
jgi:hypothetical protein